MTIQWRIKKDKKDYDDHSMKNKKRQKGLRWPLNEEPNKTKRTKMTHSKNKDDPTENKKQIWPYRKDTNLVGFVDDILQTRLPR